jgi:excisionase family DNA binding protein
VKTTQNEHAIERASDDLLTKRQLARKLQIAPRTLDLWMRKGRIPFLKLGKSVRFRWQDVLEKLSAYRVN